jgi:predicted acylesterase/phospholipase RssA
MCGGGAKVVALVGALKVLEVTGVLRGIHNFAGSSAGAILATLLACGYSVDEVLCMMVQVDFARFKDDSIGIIQDAARLVNKFGWCSGDVFSEWIDRAIRDKLQPLDEEDEPLSFDELYKRTGKTLVITACNVNTGTTHYFSRHTAPAMPVRVAVRMSMSIPFMFVPVLYHGCFYVDGGTFDNYPLAVFDYIVPGDASSGLVDKRERDQTLGFRLMADGDPFRKHRAEDIADVKQFGVALVRNMLYEIERLRTNDELASRTVQVPTLGYGTMDFSLTKKQKLELFVGGSISTQSFLAHWVSKHARRGSLAQVFRHRRKSSTDRDMKLERMRLMRHLGRHNDSVFGPLFSSVGGSGEFSVTQSVTHTRIGSNSSVMQTISDDEHGACDDAKML